MIVALFLLGLAAAASGERKFVLYDTAVACSQGCRGSRVLNEGRCFERLGTNAARRFQCTCQSGYYDVADLADDECGEKYWSWFTYGTWVHPEGTDEACSITCGRRVRVWATVFTILTFLAACAILLFMLPLLISSCMACVTAKKERKNRKKVQQAEAGYAASVVDGGGAKATVPYNPYMYWPQQYYQTR